MTTPYTPNNLTVFTAAYAGAFAGLAAGGRQPRDILTGDYTSYALVATAFAECLDGLWGVSAADTLQVFNLFLTSYGVFDARNPGISTASLNRGTYLALGQAILAAIAEAENIVTGLGITPAAWPGGGASTLAGQAFGPLDATLLQRIAIQGTTIYVDPANESGHASNANDGLTSGAPILTTLHLNSNFLFFRFLTAATTIQYLSDDTSGVSPDWSTLDGRGFELDFVGTNQLLHTGGTLNAGTIAINPAASAGGQRQVVHTTDIADWTPYLPDGTSAKRILDSTTGASAWINSAAGAAASTSQPTTTFGQAAGALTIGNGYTIVRGSKITAASTVSANPLTTITLSLFSVIGFCDAQDASFIQCSLIQGQNANDAGAIDCYVNGIQGTTFLSAGTYVTNAFDFAPLLTIQNNTYITGRQLILAEYAIQAIQFIGPGVSVFAAGAQFQDCEFQGIYVNNPTNFSLVDVSGHTDALLWGNGNGRGMLIAANTYASKNIQPTVTGTGGDIAFLESTGTVQVARAWVEATGSWTDAGGVPTRATTWANWAEAVGSGGFGFAMQDVSANIALIGVG